MNLAALQHPGKYALPGHDALAGLLLDDAVVVALLADLGHLQHHVADGEAAGDGQIAEVEALNDEVFAKGTVVHPDLLAERLDFSALSRLTCRCQFPPWASLTMPHSGVRTALGTSVLTVPRLGLVQIARIFPIVIYPPIRYIPRVAGMELSPK